MRNGSCNHAKRTGKHGFTLIELVVTLCILAILLSISVFGLSQWVKHANFVQCEEYAKTTFLLMQNALADLDSQGELGDFFEKMALKPVSLSYLTPETHELAYISVSAKDYAAYASGTPTGVSQSEWNSITWLYDCLSQGMMDTAVLEGSDGYFGSNANIIIEFDTTARTVYSVFYASWAQSLTYNSNNNRSDAHGIVSVDVCGNATSRDRTTRAPLCLGYYSTEDFPHVAELSAKKLRINTLELVNDEELYLRFSGNVPYRFENPDTTNPITYTLDLYTDTGTFICHILMDTSQMVLSDAGSGKTIVSLPVSFDKVMVGSSIPGISYTNMYFPVTVSGNEYRIVLDAMLDGVALNNWENILSGGDFTNSLSASSTYSILRLLRRAEDATQNQPDVYVKVRAYPNAVSGTGELPDYSSSAEKKSNVENCMFDTATSVTSDAEVTLRKFRHLYNIRYYADEPTAQSAVFTLRASLDWGLGKQFLYGPNGGGAYVLTASTRDDFPSIPVLKEEWTLTGRNASTAISNLKLGATSVVQGSEANNVAEFLALVLENNGKIQNLTFHSATLKANAPIALLGNSTRLSGGDLPAVRAAAILCAVNNGDISQIRFDSGTADIATTLTAAVSYRFPDPSGVALVSAIMNKSGTVSNIWTSYQSTGTLATSVTGLIAGGDLAMTDAPDRAALKAGIGGVIGYMNSDPNVLIGGSASVISNGANITGNMQTGGVVGCVVIRLGAGETVNVENPQLQNCSNTGLVLCSSGVVKDESKANPYNAYGMFIGGIVGYAENAVIYECTDNPTGKPGYTQPGAKDLLQADCRGTFVGGIVGYLTNGILDGCKTLSGGFILGHDYVGGIAGGNTGNNTEVIQYTTTNKTTNACYVLGINYVGGIVGSNSGNSVLQYCVNTGIVGGYGHNIGGIAGQNVGADIANTAIIRGCTSYIWDYTNALYRMATEYWQVGGNNVGGIVGYNEYGLVEYNQIPSVLQFENTISAIVAGNNQVGGVIGLNGQHGDLAISLDVIKVIGGRIRGTGDCVGGLIGANFSSRIFFLNRQVTEAGGETYYIYEDDPAAITDELVVQPYSVDGRYCVGGVIGANLIDQDVQIAFRATNAFGHISGNALVGGLIGYQQMLSASDADALQALLLEQHSAAYDSGAINTMVQYDPASMLFTAKLPSAPDVCATVSGVTAGTVMNNMAVSGENYIGGLLGFNAQDSHLSILDCLNSGNISSQNGVHAINLALAFPDIWHAEKQDIAEKGTFVGGIISYNPAYSVIEHCGSSGRVSIPADLALLGGIVGVNEGQILDCNISQSQGNADYSFLGGIAGLNYAHGLIRNCQVAPQTSITGKYYVGGIVALNDTFASVEGCSTAASVRAYSDYAGGLAAENCGTIRIASTLTSPSIRAAKYAGGLIGHQKSGSVSTSTDTQMDTTSDTVTVSADSYAGGLIGKLSGGTLDGGDFRLVNRAEVNAVSGMAGGIVGAAECPCVIQNADNYGTVKTSSGDAGGIISNTVPITGGNNMRIFNCVNYASVTSFAGTAGGIATCNRPGSVMENCHVRSADGSAVVITSASEYMGAITTTNEGSILNCSVATGGNPSAKIVRLSGGRTIGGIAGCNLPGGQIRYCSVYESLQLNMHIIYTATHSYMLGGLVGDNQGQISGCTVTKYFNGNEIQTKPNFTTTTITANGVKLAKTITAGGSKGFANVRYLGGIAGYNTGDISACTYHGAMHEGSGAAGNAYGGIAGYNESTITNCRTDLSFVGIGAGSFNVGDPATQKRDNVVTVGGITGANTGGVIQGCYLGSADTDMYLSLQTGLLGGIAGYNDNIVKQCGAPLVEGKTWAELEAYLDSGSPANPGSASGVYGNWGEQNNPDISPFMKQTGTLSMCMAEASSSGGGSSYLSAITALGAPTAQLSECVTGSTWTLYHNITNPDACIGGGVAYNEQTAPMSYMINQAFLYKNKRQVVGGIIGRSEIRNSDTWLLQHCYNFGQIYVTGSSGDSNRAAGILGCIKYHGGTVDDCHNYGTITSYADSGGVVGGDNQLNAGTKMIVSNCTNHGSVTCIGGTGLHANLGVAGIYGVSREGPGPTNAPSIILYNCANYGTIQSSNTYASGISADCYNMYTKYYLYNCQNYGMVQGNTAANTSTFTRSVPGTAQAQGLGALENNFSIVNADCSSWKLINASISGAETNFILDNTCQYVENAPAAPTTMIKDAKIFTETLTNGVWVRSLPNNIGLKDKTVANFFDGKKGLNDRLDYASSGDLSSPNTLRVAVEINFQGSANIQSVTSYWLQSRDYYYHLEYLDPAGNWTPFGASTVIRGNTNATTGASSTVSVDTPVTAVGLRLVVDKVSVNKYVNISEIEIFTDSAEQLQMQSQGGSYLHYYYPKSGNTFGYTADPTSALNPVISSSKGLADVMASQTEATAMYWQYVRSTSLRPVAPSAVALRQSGGTLTACWNAVPGATGYTVEIRRYDDDTLLTSKTVYNANEANLTPAEIPMGTQLIARVRSLSPAGQSADWAVTTSVLTTPTMLATPRLYVVHRQTQTGMAQVLRPDNETWLNYAKYAQDGVQFKMYFTWYNKTVTAFTQNDFLGQTAPEVAFTYTSSSDRVADAYATTTTVGYTDSQKYSVMSVLSAPPCTSAPVLKINSLTTPVISGTTTGELTCQTTITGAAGSSMNPIYRVELVAVDTDSDGTEQETVIAYEDTMVTTASNKVVVTFSSLSDDLLIVPDGFASRRLYVRAWLKESGKGYVYYFDPDAPFETAFSTAIATLNSTNKANLYREANAPAITLLPAPVMMANDGYLGQLSQDQSIAYTFKWDEDLAGADKNTYRVTVYSGEFSGDNGTILYPASGQYEEIRGNSLTIHSNTMTEDTVTVVVTRVGVSGTSVGQTSSQVYHVKRHLKELAQPLVELSDGQNELYYTVAWTQKDLPTDSNGAPLCAGYNVYAQYWDGNQPMTVQLNSQAISNSDQTMTYRVIANLERFAGKTISIYVTAIVAEGNEQYVDALPGEALTITVPKRLDAPIYTLSWNTDGWVQIPQGDEPGVVAEADYDSRVLQILARVSEEERLTGNYLMGGFVYDRLPDGLEQYLRGQMDETTSMEISQAIAAGQWKNSMTGLSSGNPYILSLSGSDYTATIQSLGIETAGRNALIFLRASTNTSISSWWTLPDGAAYYIRLPKVQLETPEGMIGAAALADAQSFLDYLQASGESPIADCQITDVLTGEAAEGTNLKVDMRTLSWESSKLAEAYSLRLIMSDAQHTQQSYGIRADRVGNQMVLLCTDPDSPGSPTLQAEGALPAMGETTHIYLPLRQQGTFAGLSGEASGQFEADSGYLCTYSVHMTGVLELSVTNVDGEYELSYQLYLPEVSGSITFDYDGTTKVVRLMQILREQAGLTAQVELHTDQYVSSQEAQIYLAD